MTIKDLGKFIKEYAPTGEKSFAPSQLSGWKIAIDAPQWLWSLLFVAQKIVINQTDVVTQDIKREEIFQVWLDQIFMGLKKFLFYGITPVFIFDGKFPEDKYDLQRERRESKTLKIDKIHDFQKSFQNLDILDRTPEMISQYRKLLEGGVYTTREDFEKIKEVFSAIGVPYNIAEGEAEQLCAALAREGLVDAVYSTDRDALVHGCPVLITKFIGNDRVTVNFLKIILEKIKLTQEQFIDLCIMSGCDYNNHTRIPRLGIIKAYKLLRDYESIDNLPSKYNPSVLNYRRARELFAPQKCPPNLQLDLHTEDLNPSLLKSYGIKHWYKELSQFYQNYPPPPKDKGKNLLEEDGITHRTLSLRSLKEVMIKSYEEKTS